MKGKKRKQRNQTKKVSTKGRKEEKKENDKEYKSKYINNEDKKQKYRNL